jgi:hypothetical protein
MCREIQKSKKVDMIYTLPFPDPFHVLCTPPSHHLLQTLRPIPIQIPNLNFSTPSTRAPTHLRNTPPFNEKHRTRLVTHRLTQYPLRGAPHVLNDKVRSRRGASVLPFEGAPKDVCAWTSVATSTCIFGGGWVTTAHRAGDGEGR